MKDKKTFFGIILIFIFLLSIGLTYAYFEVTVNVVGDRNDIKTSVGTLSILYTDGPEIVAKSIIPGWTTSKTISIENNGSLNTNYSLEWASLVNQITNDELTISATCVQTLNGSVSGTCSPIAETPVASVPGSIVHNINLDSGYKHTYVLTFNFKETSTAQNYNQGKIFNGVLNILGETYTVAGILYDSIGNPIPNATIEVHSNPKTAVTDSSGAFEIIGLESGQHSVLIKDSNDISLATDNIILKSGESNLASDKTITVNKLTNYTNINISLGESSINTVVANQTLVDKILSDTTIYSDNAASPYVTSQTGVDFTNKSSPTNGQGLYTNNKLEDGKNKYFRGGSFCAYANYGSESTSGTYCSAAGGTWSSYKCSLDLNRATCQSKGYTYYDLKNNVTFAGQKWKIVRIDENNNIRMILANDSVSSAKYNESDIDNAYVGYMYGDVSLFQDTFSTLFTNYSVINSSTYYYSATYSLNASRQYYLTGDLVSGQWNTSSICNSTVCPVANYYTCFSTSSSGTCEIMYKVSGFASSTAANIYLMKYLSTSSLLAHQNITNSTIKTAVDSWYTLRLTSYANYLADPGYCSDRSIDNGLGYGTNNTYYKTNTRNGSDATASPRLSINSGCSNASRDLFTTATSNIGNKKLTYPIGLLTVDEVRYAGLENTDRNFTNYLQFNYFFRTMSPSTHVANGGTFACNYGSLYGNNVKNSGSYRPSIALKPSVIVTSGTGTYDSPYVIQ